MIRWKDTCRFDSLHPALVLVALRADALYASYGTDCWITSVNDSGHLPNSKHYLGRAVDLRVHHLADEAARETVANTLRSAIGPQFTVLYESPGTPNAHIHVQFNGTPLSLAPPTTTL